GGPNDRGVVSTCSYEARVFGIRSAMPLRTAGALCPHAIFVPVDGAKYGRVSRQVMDILRRFTPLIEPLSIDEAFLDMTGTEGLFGNGEEVGRKIRQAVRDELELTISVGVASNRLVAKIASDLRKPDGLVVVPHGEEEAFLAPLAIERLWGVGASTRRALTDYDVKTIGDLAALPEAVLVRRFGSHGATLAARARGIGDTEVAHDVAAKSISHEHTFDVDTDEWAVIERTLLALSEGVGGRLRAAGLLAATVAVKIRDTDFVTITRQRTLDDPTDSTDVIWRTVSALTRREVKGMRVRLVGVAASGLDEQRQIPMFEVEDDKHRRAVIATDSLRERYGPRSIRRASLIHADVAAPFERDPRHAPPTKSE
ncbi:MAG: DNA polymerase IV, partial [Candidatus Limnocylindrales bacterium]